MIAAARSAAVRRRARAAPALAALALLPVACGSRASEVTEPAADPVAHPVVALGQASRVLDAVESALLVGAGSRDGDPTVEARLIGPFRELARAEARVAAERKIEPDDPARVDRLRLIVPAATSWPRFFIAVGNTNATSTPVLRVLSSSQPRSPYGLWAEAIMLPGATLPETATAAAGTEVVAPEADGLVATPKEALGGFAGYLNARATSTASKQFRRSLFSDQLLQQLAGDRQELKNVATVSSKHAVGSSDPLALRTADGGALVFGELRQDYVITIKKGKGSVDVTDKNLAALAGGQKKIKKLLTRTAVEIVVLKVPPRGQGLITVIAAQKGDVKAVIK